MFLEHKNEWGTWKIRWGVSDLEFKNTVIAALKKTNENGSFKDEEITVDGMSYYVTFRDPEFDEQRRFPIRMANFGSKDKWLTICMEMAISSYAIGVLVDPTDKAKRLLK